MAGIYLGSTDLSSATLYGGSTSVTKAYIGSNIVFGSSVPDPVLTNLEQWIDPINSVIAGTSVSDLSGNGKSGTIVGGMGVDAAGWVLGSGKYLNLGMQNTNFSADYTIEIWFNASTVPGTGPGIIYQYGSSGRPQTGVAQDGTVGWYSQTRSTTGSDFALRWAGAINDSTYHQLVVTRVSGTTYFYRDAVLADSNATNLGNLTQNNPFQAGGPIGGFLRYWNATDRMGLTRIYTKGLSQPEVLQNYDANKGDYGL